MFVPEELNQLPTELPVVALRELVIFPLMVMPIRVGRPKSVKAVDAVAADLRMFITVMQKDKDIQDPKPPDELYQIGTLVNILRMMRSPEGDIQLLLRGVARVRIEEWTQTDPYLKARYSIVDETVEQTVEVQALVNTAKDMFRQMAQLSPQIPEEAMNLIVSINNPAHIADLLVSTLNISMQERQRFLEMTDPIQRLRELIPLLSREIQVLELTQKIQEQARQELDKAQREFILRQQLREIQKELGETQEAEIEELRKKIEAAGMPEEVKEVALRELDRLSKMHPAAAEYTVSRTYIDWLVSLPWSKVTEDNLDIANAKQVLDEDHYDLDDVKDRLLEFLAVRKLKQDTKGPILCFVGPPGVGKTSLGQSIARALGRKFVRMSLGGVRDEAEIRGHRRTYVGALPGRIIQGLRQAGTKNPVFMLDEVDKIGFDFRGDPAAALLEVLDPEQNHTFVDHYLDVPFDLSQVLFICTANMTDTIPPALLDRMEVIRLPGYSREEKLQIAKRYLIPRNLKEHGLTEENIEFTDEALAMIVKQYTREAGVRNLNREIANICRKVARRVAEGNTEKVIVTPQNVPEFLGPPKSTEEIAERQPQVGVATGLAWTPFGGSVLFVETTKMPGKGALIITGYLGEIMKESAQAALSYVRSRSEQLGIPEDFFGKHDIHIHVPAGAIPKDGPSAGITMATALASLATGRPVRHDIAMTGEITLTGRVLPVGGIKEKVLAAKEAGINEVILPAQNEKDLVEIPEHIRNTLQFHFVENMDEVLGIALLPAPEVETVGVGS
ncbi:MAG: endopeptidase La [Armatimonadetes bacterium]|nr:endopeptidase La [Armatimonadota bacterium]MCX7967621.1 endopeptidase La [Armatimonadota bacterium]MDW8142862.1 endopeptidase La [Armatimonadota bacterium]